MYHYVREYNSKLPFFRFLDAKNFEKQLDYFDNEYGFVTKEEWLKVLNYKNLGSAKGKILLTFDDALSCHYDFVFQKLKNRGGVCFMYQHNLPKGKILDVHRIHLLCGAFEGIELLETLKEFLDKDMIPDEKIKEFRKTYTRQKTLQV